MSEAARRKSASRAALVAAALALAGCRSILGIEPAPGEIDAGVAPDAWVGAEVFADDFATYDPAVWEGQLWCGNELEGDYVPEVGGAGLALRTSATCIGQIRTRAQWEPPLRVVVSATLHLRRDVIPNEFFHTSVADDWLDYGEGKGVGLYLYNGDTAPKIESAGSSLAPIASYDEEVPLELVLEVDAQGGATLRAAGAVRELRGVFPSGASLAVYLANGNSDLGVDVHHVSVERPEAP